MNGSVSRHVSFIYFVGCEACPQKSINHPRSWHTVSSVWFFRKWTVWSIISQTRHDKTTTLLARKPPNDGDDDEEGEDVDDDHDDDDDDDHDDDDDDDHDDDDDDEESDPGVNPVSASKQNAIAGEVCVTVPEG